MVYKLSSSFLRSTGLAHFNSGLSFKVLIKGPKVDQGLGKFLAFGSIEDSAIDLISSIGTTTPTPHSLLKSLSSI